MRIRALVNAELIAENDKGEERTMPIGSGTYFEAKQVEVYEDEAETYANITLLDGFKLNGVVWNSHTFENHGVPQVQRPKLPEVGETLIRKEVAVKDNLKLKELNDKFSK